MFNNTENIDFRPVQIRRIGIITLNVSLTIWLLYISYVLKILTNNNLIFNAAQNLMLLILALSSIKNIKYKNNYYFIQITTIVYLMCMIYIGRNNYIIFYLADIGKYLLLFILFYFNKKTDNPLIFGKIINSFVDTLYISVPLTIIVSVIMGLRPGGFGERMVASNEGFDTNPVVFISYAVFLSPFYKILSNNQKRILISALLLELLMGLFTASRAITIMPILGFITIAYFNVKFKLVKIFQAILLFTVCVGLASVIFNFSRISGSSEYLIYRFTQSEDFSNGRDTEQSIYLASISTKELILGKGLGGANKTWIWEDTPYGMSVLHKGYMYQLLKGGIAWIFIYYLIFVLALFNLFRKRKNYIYKMAFLSISMILISEISHSVWLNPMVLTFQLFLLSLALNIKKIHPKEHDILYNYSNIK